MSVSLKSTKAVMYSEIERLRAECSRLEAKVVVAQPEVAKVVRDKTIFIVAAKAQRAEFEVARTMFIRDWCRDNDATSIPGDVVNIWASARK